MKLVKYLFLLASAFCFSAAMAQQKTNKSAIASTKPAKETKEEELRRIKRELNETFYSYLKKQTSQGMNILKEEDAKRIIEYFNNNEEFRKKKEKAYGTGYSKPIVFERPAVESDRIKWLKNIPVPKYPEQAIQADPRENDAYADKVKKYVEQLRIEAQKLVNSTDLAKTYQQGGTEAVKKKYEKDADKNAIVAQMGGSEKLQNMSQQEREEAAKKMVSDMTGGLTPEQIQNMTPEQKQALAKRMAATKMQSGAQRPKANQEEMAEAEEIKKINDFSAQFYADLKTDLAPYNKISLQYELQTIADREILSKWAGAATSVLPVTRDSEYGPVREGVELVSYTIAYMSYILERNKIERQRELWEKYVRIHATAFQKLDEFAATYSKRTGLSDQMKLALANVMIAGYEWIIDLNKTARLITAEAGTVLYDYNCKVLRDCKAARQDN